MSHDLPTLRVDGVAHVAWCSRCQDSTFLTEHGIGEVYGFCPPDARSRFKSPHGAPLNQPVRCLACGARHTALADRTAVAIP